MHVRALFTLTCATAVIAAIVVSAATAAQPVPTPFNVTATDVETDLCAFPVTVQGTITGTLTFFSDASGTATRATLHGVEQDVLSANGKSLTSLPYTVELMAPVESDGSFGAITGLGIFEKVPLPGGGLFITAGHDVRVRTGSVSIPQKGAVVNLAGFCAALAS